MIRGIVAIDSKNGMANEQGIPWHLPNEAKYYVDHIRSGKILMGYDTYLEMSAPYHGGPDFVATHRDVELKPGFIRVPDARKWLGETEGDVWNVGGPGLLASTMDLLDEFYITRIDADFHATKFLPDFTNLFELCSESEPMEESGVEYRFQIWHRKNTQKEVFSLRGDLI